MDKLNLYGTPEGDQPVSRNPLNSLYSNADTGINSGYTGTMSEGDKYRMKMYDDDTVVNELIQASTDPVLNTYLTAKKTIFDEEDELVNVGLYKTEIKSLQNQNAIDYAFTGLDLAMVGSYAAFAASVGACIFGMVGCAAIPKTAVAAFGLVSFKGIAKNAMKKAGDIGNTARKSLTPQFYKELSLSHDEKQIAEILRTKFNVEKGTQIMEEAELKTIAHMIAKEDDVANLEKMMEFQIKSNYDKAIDPLKKEMMTTIEDKIIDAEANAVVKKQANKLAEDYGVNNIYRAIGDSRGKTEKVQKKSTKEIDKLYKMRQGEFDKIDITKTKIGEGALVTPNTKMSNSALSKFAKDKAAIEQLYKNSKFDYNRISNAIESAEITKLNKILADTGLMNSNEIMRLQKKIDAFAVANKKELSAFNKLKNDLQRTLLDLKAAKELKMKDEIAELKVDTINKQVDVDELAKNINKKTTGITVTEQIRFFDKVAKANKKAENTYKRQLARANKAEQVAIKKQMAINSKKAVLKSEPHLLQSLKHPAFKGVAPVWGAKIAKAKTFDQIKKIRDDIIDKINKYENKTGVKFNKAIDSKGKKALNDEYTRVTRLLKTLAKDKGVVDKMLKKFDNLLANSGANIFTDQNVVVRGELEAQFGILRTIQDRVENGTSKMTVKEINNLINKFVDTLDEVKDILFMETKKNYLMKEGIDATADGYSNIINKGDFGIKEAFSTTGIMKTTRKFVKDYIYSTSTQGSNKLQYDKYVIKEKKGVIKQVYHDIHSKSINEHNLAAANHEYKLENLAKDAGVFDDIEAQGMLADYAHIGRKDKGIDMASRYTRETEWNAIQKHIDYGKINTEAVKNNATKKADEIIANNPKKYDELTDVEKTSVRDDLIQFEYRKDIAHKYWKQLDDLYNNGSDKSNKIMKYLRFAQDANNISFNEANRVAKLFDKDAKIKPSVEGYFVKAQYLDAETGAVPKIGIEEGIKYDFLGHATTKKKKTSPTHVFGLSKQVSEEKELIRNFEYLANRTFKETDKYKTTRPAEYMVNKIINDTREVIGDDFAENILLEMRTNSSNAFVAGKGLIGRMSDQYTAEVAHAILGLSVTTPTAQFTAIADFINSFNDIAKGNRAIKVGSAFQYSNGKEIDNFFTKNVPEYAHRVSDIADRKGSNKGMKAVYGSTELFEGRTDFVKESSNKAYRLAKKGYQKYKDINMFFVQKADGLLYKPALTGAYIVKLEDNGIRVTEDNFKLLFSGNKADLPLGAQRALDDAIYHTGKGMMSTTITEQSQFKKLGSVGTRGEHGGNQTMVRVLSLLQTSVHSSYSRMVEMGGIVPSKIWRDGQKKEAIEQLMSFWLLETYSKAMYLVNKKYVNQGVDVLTGGTGEPSERDKEDMVKQLAEEYLAHIPLLGGFVNSQQFSRVPFIPAHFGAVGGSLLDTWGLATGGIDYDDMSSWQKKQFIEGYGYAFRFPGTTPLLSYNYKYDKNHLPEYEMQKKLLQQAKKQVKEDNQAIVEAVLNQHTFENEDGDEINPLVLLDQWNKGDKESKKRVGTIMESINLQQKYDEKTYKEILKIRRLNNSLKATWFVEKSQSEQDKWKAILIDANMYTKDLRKKIGIERRAD